ncbi:MAG: galactokinase family protein [Pseudomonadota bacterium]|nr:galactokinase family protein [Pseudomonadota bacterium]
MNSNDLAARERVVAAAPHARLCFAPGRVNLIGDHIDYLGGTVLPMSIDRGTWFGFEAGATSGLTLEALDRGEVVRVSSMADVDALAAHDWHAFLKGSLALGRPTGAPLAGRIVFAGDLWGGGLSSSASFGVGLARVLAELGVLPRLEGIGLARLAQRVEHQFVGVQCGLMDQLAVVLGRSGGAIALQCESGEFAPVSLHWPDHRLLVMRSRSPRTLASGGYNTRRAELAIGLARLDLAEDAMPAPDALDGVDVDDVPWRRVRHVISEQLRVEQALLAAEASDWAAFGALMTASHVSLRDDYEVSTPALDAIVEAAVATRGCEGARLTGAGFGGWTIALVRNEAVDAVRSAVDAALHAPLADEEWFVARPGGPVRLEGASDAR